MPAIFRGQGPLLHTALILVFPANAGIQKTV